MGESYPACSPARKTPVHVKTALGSPYFNDRLRQRGLMWADVQAIIDRPGRVKGDGLDPYDRPRFLIRGRMPDTPELQASFGQPSGQKKGCGFPTATLLVLCDAAGFIVNRGRFSPPEADDGDG